VFYDGKKGRKRRRVTFDVFCKLTPEKKNAGIGTDGKKPRKRGRGKAFGTYP